MLAPWWQPDVVGAFAGLVVSALAVAEGSARAIRAKASVKRLMPESYAAPGCDANRPPAVRRQWVLAAAVLIRGAAGGGVAAPTVTDDTLVRIDPATNKVDRVVEVAQRPSAVAVGGRTVWVYNDGDPSVSEIDAATGDLRHETRVIAAPTHLDPFSGPVLAANAAGAWLVSTDARGRSYLGSRQCCSLRWRPLRR
jgi:hypothetical protein